MPRRRRYDRPGRPCLKDSEGLQILIVELGEVFDSYSEAANRIGGRRSGVYSCLRGTGRRRTHMGYTFRYVKNL